MNKSLKCRTKKSERGNAEQAVSLYLHFPFCVRKCRYCDFLSGPSDADVRERYLRALETELRGTAALREMAHPITVDTIFLGGGTPSLLTGEQLMRLMAAVRDCYDVLPDAEITMECNPGTADRERLRGFHVAGVNRLSMGVQSFRDEELQLLGRIHTAREARQCYEDARAAGFTNISLDLMSALPGQTMEAWMESLRQAAELEPEHLSAYSLILEEGTMFSQMMERGELPPLPEEDLDRQMYHETKRFLEEHGYHRYEISNYAKDGYESRHNSGYWTGHPYLGFGVGAASYLGDCRWNHVRNVTKYCEILEQQGAESCVVPGNGRSMEQAEATLEEGPVTEHTAGVGAADTAIPHEGGGSELYEEVEYLTREDRMAECMFLGLRRMQGVSEEQFRRRFGCSMESVYGKVIRRYEELGMLRREGGYLALTDPGIDVCNGIMADFLL